MPPAKLILISVILLSMTPVVFGQGLLTFKTKTSAEIIQYLASNTIPDFPWGTVSGPSLEHTPQYREEVVLALSLFKNGSPELRLAIARSIAWTAGIGMEFWDACTPEDIEARHYLLGRVMNTANVSDRAKLRKWLLKDAHPSYAGALLTSLNFYPLYELNEPFDDKFLPIIRSLYRQPGFVFRLTSNSIGLTTQLREIPIQQRAISLMPPTQQARDMLLEWMSIDSKKIDANSIGAMWSKLEEMQIRGIKLPDGIESKLEIIESWCLSSIKPFELRFQRSAWLQIYNPDSRVRKAAIEYFIVGSGYPERFELISKEQIPKLLRTAVISDVEGQYEAGKDAYSIHGPVRARDRENEYHKLIDVLRK